MSEKKGLIKTKKQMFLVIGTFALILLLGTVSYAFFNYTRTGTSNTASVGRIYFNTDQNNDTLTLTNVFPSNSVPAGADSVSVHIVGDTAYFDGEEYMITLVNVVNTINAGTANEKTVPINYVATYQATTNKVVGSQAVSDYYTERTANVYDLTATGVVEEGVEVLKGYIAPSATGIDGTLTIKAYLDASKVVISDTYPTGEISSEVSGENYQNGTTSSYVGDKVVLTTSEWNALQGNSTLSFKIKAEANEGKWIPLPPFRGTAAQMAASATSLGLETTDYGNIYVGSNPDNYVWFNNEQWRIIGVYGDKLKIVKATPLAGQNYNNSNSDGNVWAGSRLETYLNQETEGGYYYTLSSTAKSMIVEGTWNAGAAATNAIATTAYNSATSTQVSRKVGLIATYEYLYAAGNSCRNVAGNAFTTCIGQDWLKPSSYIWTLSPRSGLSSDALRVRSDGIVHNYNVSSTIWASPAVYLKSTITITGGNGGEGETDSYKLG